MYHPFFFSGCWCCWSLCLMLFHLLNWEESLAFFSFVGVENEKILLFLRSKACWWLDWVDNSRLLSWGVSTLSWKIYWLFWLHIFPFSLSEILQGTILCVGVVIGIINMPSLLNDLPSASNTSWEDLLGSSFIGTQASHLLGIWMGRSVWKEAGTCCMYYLEGNTFSILILLYLS